MLQLPGPYVRATGASLVNVELLEDVEAVDFEGEESEDFHLLDCYFLDPLPPAGARKVVGAFSIKRA